MNQEEAIEAAKALPWARWVAQDADGSWWAHATKPEFRMGEWDTGGLVAKLRPRDLKPGPCIKIQR